MFCSRVSYSVMSFFTPSDKFTLTIFLIENQMKLFLCLALSCSRLYALFHPVENPRKRWFSESLDSNLTYGVIVVLLLSVWLFDTSCKRVIDALTEVISNMHGYCEVNDWIYA